jgi:DNA-binding Lrp family transcriptional regulator
MNLINVGGKSMIVDERRSRILQIAEESGFVSLQRLVAEIGASESTIRRDLEYLDSSGKSSELVEEPPILAIPCPILIHDEVGRLRRNN